MRNVVGHHGRGECHSMSGNQQVHRCEFWCRFRVCGAFPPCFWRSGFGGCGSKWATNPSWVVYCFNWSLTARDGAFIPLTADCLRFWPHAELPVFRCCGIGLALCLPLLGVGCCLSPIYLVERSALAQALPSWVQMDDYVRDVGGRVTEEYDAGQRYVRDFGSIRVSVGMELARLGAYVGRDGKIYDLSGRRIEFFHHYEGGPVPPPELWEDAQRHLEELKKTCTVIETSRDPRLPPPE